MLRGVPAFSAWGIARPSDKAFMSVLSTVSMLSLRLASISQKLRGCTLFSG